LAVVVAVLIGLATWEPLLAERVAAPPERKYDSVIARDRWGTPHVFGRTDPDVAYGIGYAHAEDDFSTLQEVLAMTRGRLGAITGQDGAKTDFAMHLLNARATVDRDYDRQPADVRALLDGYASGLNAYARRHPGEVKLAKLFPINGRDVVTGFVVRSPFFFGLDGVLGALVGDKALPLERAPSEPGAEAPSVTPAGPRPTEAGSNAFVVAPEALGRRLDAHDLQLAPAVARRRRLVRAGGAFGAGLAFRRRHLPRRALSAARPQSDAGAGPTRSTGPT
jgi:acyl-homoserine-lactone acylase